MSDKVIDLFFSKTLNIEKYDGFHILQDHMGTNHTSPWDDYDYTIKFKLYYVNNNEKSYLGFLRLLVNGCQNTSKFLLGKGQKVDGNIYKINNTINSELAVSLPLEIDYYHKINKLLGADNVEEFLSVICDASYYYNKINDYKNWSGFNGAVMRGGSSAEAILRKGHQIAIGRYSPENSFEIEIDPDPNRIEPVQFFFDNTRDVGATNINLLTGKNGVGKSFVLKELTKVVTGLKEIGRQWPFFHKLIVVAYSPFEDFYTKDDLLSELDKKYSSNNKSKRKTRERRRLNINEYAYVGFRNEAGKFSLDWPKKHSFESLKKILEFDKENYWWEDRGRFEILKETLLLCMDFDNIAVKKSDSEEFLIINEASKKSIEDLKTNASKEDGVYFIKDGEPLSLSSGQRIYSYMIPAVVSEIENESLIIFDEPELYLHPHLEVGLINMMKHLLSETSSYSIIATHSAILTREVEKRGVKIFRKGVGKTIVANPGFETYGESLESIIGEVFDDHYTDKPFEHDLDEYVKSYDNLDTVLEKIGEDIGDEALAYLMAKFTENSKYVLGNE